MKDRKGAILRRLALGLDFKSSCEDVGISRQTGYRMRKADPGFGAEVKRLQASGKLTEEEYAFDAREAREAPEKIDIRRREYARTGVLPEVQRYAPGDIRHESTARKPEDPGWRPGFQDRGRQLQVLARQAAREHDRVRRWQSNPFNWGTLPPDDFR